MKNIFTQEVTQEVINRINQLTPETKALWGKMTVAQMLAHCNVTYELVYDNKIPKATGIKKFLLTAFVKKAVVSETSYKRNSQTGSHFIIKETKDFHDEKTRLIAYLEKTQALGEKEFEGKESNSFGALNATEWNNMFYKHLDHHLGQFGV